MKYFNRTIAESIRKLIPFFRVIVVTGARQVGKTTLCKKIFPEYEYVNLESGMTREMIANEPQNFIDNVSQGVIIDEAHRLPELFSYIQLDVDEHPDKRYILTGSSNFAMLEQITQSLAGRAALFTLPPLSIQEMYEQVKDMQTNELLFHGLYPASFSDNMPTEYLYSNYYNTYIERDLHQLINVKNLSLFQLFIRLCAGRVGAECNYSALASETGVSAPTLREWMSILEASYILYKLPPYYSNISKRLVKTPKVYFFDTGILCFLLGIENPNQLATHPLRGAIFENLVVMEFVKSRLNEGKLPNLFFYRDSRGTEIDLVETEANNLHFYEIKSSQTFNGKFFDNIKKVSKLFDDRVTKTAVIYDGKDTLPSVKDGIYNFRVFPYNE
ncbi:MAG: ATP-binding protein [Bacteroidales bacterium]|nr:ATP-binding protein [Bacteroidales bacterium]